MEKMIEMQKKRKEEKPVAMLIKGGMLFKDGKTTEEKKVDDVDHDYHDDDLYDQNDDDHDDHDADDDKGYWTTIFSLKTLCTLLI